MISLILAINQIGLAEGLALGRSLGIDPLLLHNVINTSSGTPPILRYPAQKLSGADGFTDDAGQSWSSKVNSPLKEVENSPGSRGYKGGFLSRLMLKVCSFRTAGICAILNEQDVGLALSAAHVHDLPLPLGWASKSVYEAVCEEGEGEMASQDFRYALHPRMSLGRWLMGSVVLEWLRKKQEQGVERGWKDHTI
jgi:3-hydroxyisobutyrate dehydrogenase